MNQSDKSDDLEESNDDQNLNETEEIEEILSTNDDFQKLSDESKKDIVKKLVVSQHMHAGPIPDPETLFRYNEIIPNGADRIMSMAENQQKHRLDIEKRVVRSNNVQSYLGQIFGFLIGLGALGAAVYMTLHDKPWPGGVLGLGAIAGLVSVFVIGKKMQAGED